MTNEIEKLSDLGASGVLALMITDEVPEGYRDEVWIEKINEEVVDNWFVGSNGAISMSGTTLTPEEWEDYKITRGE